MSVHPVHTSYAYGGYTNNAQNNAQNYFIPPVTTTYYPQNQNQIQNPWGGMPSLPLLPPGSIPLPPSLMSLQQPSVTSTIVTATASPRMTSAEQKQQYNRFVYRHFTPQ